MKRERGEGSEKSDEPEEREKGKKGERSGVRIPKAVPALQAVVVLKAVLVDGLADLTADLAADGAAAEASCDSADGGACGATAVEGFDAGGLALGATGHGGSPWVCDVKERRATERTDKEKAPGAGHAGLEGGE